MTKFVVVVFNDEKHAYEGLEALRTLHNAADLTLYESAVIQRGADGRANVRAQDTDALEGTGVGALVGGVLGLMAWPVAAAAGVAGAAAAATAGAVGLSAGTALGAMRDLYDLGVTDEFLDAVAQRLLPGKTAVVAEISEEWEMPLDVRMDELGGNVIRESRDDFVDEQLEKRIAARRAALEQRKAELESARAERVAAVKRKVADTEQSLRRLGDDAKGRLDRYRRQTDAKLSALQQQAEKARADARTRIEQRIAEIRADRQRRGEKLQQAFKLTQEALGPSSRS